jgi:16S rRNA (guanine527-N7)-methyltransferase
MELITKYFSSLTTVQKERLTQLKPLYEEWNAKINVISRKNMDEFYCNHVLHSLSIAQLYPLTSDDVVLDIGTGGGFPGIPLAILFPETRFTLVDSIRKKTTVVSGVAEALGLKNITVVNDRFENITDKHNVIVSRAVAPALKLVKLTKTALAKGGMHILLKGGDLEEEMKNLTFVYKKAKFISTALSTVYSEDFFETKKIIKVDLQG